MRKEFKAKTGLDWEAKEFGGWNAISELFKELRNMDEHVEPIILEIDYNP